MLTSSPPMGSDTWLCRLSEWAGRHTHLTSVDHTGLDRATAALLGPSLAIFQLGESGTGEHLFEAARRAGTDADYRQCLQHFIAEEQEHARLLALVLDALGEPLRRRHWTDGAFVLIRRAHSLRTEILVLMVAEVVALSYYGALAEDTVDAVTLRRGRCGLGPSYGDKVPMWDVTCAIQDGWQVAGFKVRVASGTERQPPTVPA